MMYGVELWGIIIWTVVVLPIHVLIDCLFDILMFDTTAFLAHLDEI
jgi:hypothetical protein